MLAFKSTAEVGEKAGGVCQHNTTPWHFRGTVEWPQGRQSWGGKLTQLTFSESSGQMQKGKLMLLTDEQRTQDQWN